MSDTLQELKAFVLSEHHTHVCGRRSQGCHTPLLLRVCSLYGKHVLLRNIKRVHCPYFEYFYVYDSLFILFFSNLQQGGTEVSDLFMSRNKLCILG